MKKIISLIFIIILTQNYCYSQSKSWIKLFTNAMSETIQSKSVKNGMLEAFESSSSATKEVFRKMDIPPKDIQKITKRFSQKELATLTLKMDGISPNAMRSFYSDLARKSDGASKRFVDAINTNPKLLKSYQRVYNTGLGVKFRTSPQVLSDVSNKVSPVTLKTTNYGNAGKKLHDIPIRKRIISIGGIKYEGVFPDFNDVSVFNMKLPNNLVKEGDEDQMKYATKMLRRQLSKDPQKAKLFSSEQITAIINGNRKIPGYTWHHKEAPAGAMQLIPVSYHSKIGHDGGKTFWNGGNR